ncbi:isopentenyl-diphosphate Delta-isomerase [Corynebacterium doosanense]|uniref:Isopentenyl-diphosphate Delta-isomerase n=1 Tax=Corynebacterium doosanense CAU 212 = DSM 45436 TaxID=558173 RepID=A0A097IHH4_9CORY|nr:isopentenyl-diphosphate Delta-isomerase [Corynebacterium doosanense]AIT61597.1 isopentenyl-diphosphate delta-isomerase [Corynebacterium doosanense CAU 212 = DSM 45436]
MSDEYVVLADAHGRPSGTADKATVHTDDTPLHFAFSAYLVDSRGRVLLTRRALSKIAWPGVWTNSFCGHPGPGESTPDAIRRRAAQELGIDPDNLTDIREVLGDFSYRATDSSGIVENEICPVYVVSLRDDSPLNPHPDEVDSSFWIAADQLFAAVDAAPPAFSPWLVKELGDDRLRAELARTAS